jgi:hypothetical protein
LILLEGILPYFIRQLQKSLYDDFWESWTAAWYAIIEDFLLFAMEKIRIGTLTFCGEPIKARFKQSNL